MINVNNIKSTGIINGIVTYLIDFSFDNFSTLPQKIYQNGLSSYLLADGSTATNVSDNTLFVYNNGRWIKDGKSTSPKEDNSNIFTDNGNYSITNNDSTGVNNITVDVEQGSPEPTLISKTITENGNYSASDDEADGYSDVDVNVAPNVTSKNITANGTYNASSDNVDGYNSVKVSVTPKLKYKVINDNGTYIASSDNVDGYSTANVYVSPYINSIRTVCVLGDDYCPLTVLDSNDGDYTVDEPIVTHGDYLIVFLSPVKSITFGFNISNNISIKFAFSPAEGETVGFFDVSGNSISYSGEIDNSGNYIHMGTYRLSDGLEVYCLNAEFPSEIQ